jgi:hypothetical protein
LAPTHGPARRCSGSDRCDRRATAPTTAQGPLLAGGGHAALGDEAHRDDNLAAGGSSEPIELPLRRLQPEIKFRGPQPAGQTAESLLDTVHPPLNTLQLADEFVDPVCPFQENFYAYTGVRH